ncbi:hypothetical protein C8R45DRAFT_947076 [Mycena sanguinolenta]|nr:hypothetical protein C8R45DRAFT_947076 [Mycena sanguinolenta]
MRQWEHLNDRLEIEALCGTEEQGGNRQARDATRLCAATVPVPEGRDTRQQSQRGVGGISRLSFATPTRLQGRLVWALQADEGPRDLTPATRKESNTYEQILVLCAPRSSPSSRFPTSTGMEHPWTPAQDKVLKSGRSEALHCADKCAPISAKLEVWLGYYDAPSPGVRNPTNYVSKRADLFARIAAKKIRRDKLVDLRTRALQASARKWPQPRCHPHHPANQERWGKERREEEERIAAERAQERAIVEARVAHLMKLRAGMKGRRV